MNNFLKSNIALLGLLISVAVISSIFIGCATRGEINTFKMQLDYLESSNAKMQRQINKIDSLVTQLNSQMRGLKANQQAKLASVQNQIRIIEEMLKESGNQYSNLSEKLEDLRSEFSKPTTTPDSISSDSTAAQEEKKDSTRTEEDKETQSKKKENKSKKAPNPQQLYNTAFLDQTKGNYKLAISSYRQYLDLYPDGAFAPNCQYQIAECYFSMEKYEKAIEEYLQLTSQYDKSKLAPSGYYKIALSYLRQEDKAKAKKYLNKVIELYPSSKEASLAKDKLENLN